MNKKRLTSLITGALLVTSAQALACTTIIVGNEQSTDGSYLIGRNEDYKATNAKHFIYHPHATNQTGEFKSAIGNDFTYPLPAESLAYTSVHDFDSEDKSMGEVGFNELGVAFTGTETIDAGEKALAVDPYVEDTGITEDAIENIILPRAHTAKEGIELLGKIIEEHGSGEGFGVAIGDKDGVWYLENAAGHRWMAVKMPKDKYFVSANQGRLREYDPNDKENYMGSADLIEFAVANGLYDPAKDGKFDFHKAYSQDVERDKKYNYPRVWVLQNMITSGLNTKVDQGTEFPVFLKADKKMSVETVKSMLRNHYNGTEHDPYNNANPNEFYRPISVFRGQESHVMQIRPNMPAEIGNVNYLAIGMPSLGLYLPYYQGMTSYIPGYEIGTDQASDDSVNWTYRKLQTLVMQNYKEYAPIVIKTYADFEAETAKKQVEMEKQYLAVYQQYPEQAKAILQDFENKVMQDGLQLTKDLTNQIFTKLTADTDTKYKFSGH